MQLSPLKKLHLKLKMFEEFKRKICVLKIQKVNYITLVFRDIEKKRKEKKKKDSRNLGKIDENPVKQQMSLPGSLNITMLKKKIKQKEQNVHQAR